MARLLAVILIVFNLQGCVSQSGRDGASTLLASLSAWQLRGKLGVRSDAGNANLSFVWNESPERYDISLKGPMGVAVARVAGDANRALLEMPDGREYASSTVESLIEEQLGYSLPVSLLRYWLRGVPDPAHTAQYQEKGFSQLGWQVAFQQFSSQGPKKILIEKADIRLKLAALKWDY